MLSAKKRAALGDVSNRCFGRPAADALASFYKDADTSSLLLAPDIHLLILEHVGAPAYVVTAGGSKSWREAVLIKLRAAGVDCRADVADFFRRDPTLPYKAGIMAYHLTLENATKPAKVAQPEINGAMTTILMDWLGEGHRHFMLAPPTLHIAASILHHYLRLVRVERKELQLVGTTALFIAGKYEEIFPPLAKDYAYLADAPNCNKEDIIATEAKILHTLEYNISQMAHALPFLTRYLQVCEPAPPPLSPLAHYLVELSLGADAERPSLLAAAAVYLARATLGLDWNDELSRASGYTALELRPCTLVLRDIHARAEKSPHHRGSREKYSSEALHEVAKMEPAALAKGVLAIGGAPLTKPTPRAKRPSVIGTTPATEGAAAAGDGGGGAPKNVNISSRTRSRSRLPLVA